MPDVCVLRFVYSGNAKTLELTQNNTFTHTQHFYKKKIITQALQIYLRSDKTNITQNFNNRKLFVFFFFLLKKNLRNI